LAIRIGVDTGGTFTDIVVYDDKDQTLQIHKVHSTPDDPGRAMVTGSREVLGRLGETSDAVKLLVHGTTIATNALLQRRGARTALITTAGFRDILHIQRQNRPRMYDLRSRRALPLIPRRRRFELNERIGPDGDVIKQIDTNELEALCHQLAADKIEAVAICLLHSYENASHELEVAAALRSHLPDATVCTSHEVARQIGEYERFSTCSVNAYLQPAMQSYLSKLESELANQQICAPLYVMKSNGGVMSASEVARQCVQTILSGPSGGVVAGVAIAKQLKNSNLITADMGGTSFDVAVIEDGKANFARVAEIDGIALKVPMLDLHTVGAGGGSIGWIDAGGALRAGPHSAGSAPGPVCYGKGGTEPTVTDANLVLGRLAAKSKLAGGMELDLQAAREAIQNRLAKPLNLSVEEAAEGMVQIVNSTMVAAIRKLTVERGLDPRSFVMCPFGGAGPLHGSELARGCGIEQTLVPLAPGVTSAMGLLMSNLREDQVNTHIAKFDQMSPESLQRMLDEMARQAADNLVIESDAVACVTRKLALRYLGQSHDVPLSISEMERLDPHSIAQGFHQAHEKLFGFSRPEEPLELVSLWVSVELDLRPLELPHVEQASELPEQIDQRAVVFQGESLPTPIYERDALAAGHALTGPAIVEQVDTTTLIWPGEQAAVDDYGQIMIGEAKPGRHADGIKYQPGGAVR